MISGTFAVAASGRESVIAWAHTIAGFAMIYLIIAMLLRAIVSGTGRALALCALLFALLEAIPGQPRIHAFVSPLLFACLFRASLPAPGAVQRGKRVWWLPALVLTAIFFGVGYRYQSASVVAHLGIAMVAAGLLIGLSMMIQEKTPAQSPVRGAAALTIAAVIFQITAGIAVLVIRMIDRDGGLPLATARTAHFTGAGILLGITVLLVIQYRRTPVAATSSYPPPPAHP